MKNIATHKAVTDYSIEELEKKTLKLLTKDKETASRDMSWACTDATMAIAHGAWARTIGDDLGARRLFSIGSDYSVGAFLAIGRPGEPIEFSVEGETVRAHGVSGEVRPPKPVDWIECVSTALCLRRKDALAVLTRFPVDLFERSRDAFWKPLCLAVQRFIEDDPTWAKLGSEATELAQAAQHESPKTIERYVSMVPTLRAIAEHDQQAFTSALVGMLQAHKAEASRGPRKDSGPSLLALPACGMAALGVERGLELEVESGYLPAWLVKNETP